WDRMVEVNQRFADEAVANAAPGATVWVHDYQLQLVPEMIRRQRPDLRIGFFLHIPFPSSGQFANLPREWGDRILRGLLGADLVGFQTPGDVEKFHEVVQERLQLPTEVGPDGRTVLEHDGRRVTLDAFPISIDFASVDELARSESMPERAAEIRAEFGNPKRLIVGLDRLDPSKGIPERLRAFQALLRSGELNPADVVMVQSSQLSREGVAAYQNLLAETDRLVREINAEFGTPDRPVVHHLIRTINEKVRTAFFQAADVLMVTPQADGMNLVAKEFVASRPDLGGVLLLSKWAGAAVELTDAVLVDPQDADDMREGLLRALTMDPDEARTRMQTMREHVAEHDVARWAGSFLASMQEIEDVSRLERRATAWEIAERAAVARLGGMERLLGDVEALEANLAAEPTPEQLAEHTDAYVAAASAHLEELRLQAAESRGETEAAALLGAEEIAGDLDALPALAASGRSGLDQYLDEVREREAAQRRRVAEAREEVRRSLEAVRAWSAPLTASPDQDARPAVAAGLDPALVEAVRVLAATEKLLVATDFDGTVSPIVPVPSEAYILPAAADALRTLSELADTTVALVSGRGRTELAELSGVADVARLVGGHGVELSGEFALPAEAAERRARLGEALAEITADVPGVVVEQKQASVAVHVRHATKDVAARVMNAIAHGPGAWTGIENMLGKDVWELSVLPASKGAALDALRAELGATSMVFLGDDVTDEKGFVALRAGEVGVKVGPGETTATYRVASPADVAALLQLLAEERARVVAGPAAAPSPVEEAGAAAVTEPLTQTDAGTSPASVVQTATALAVESRTDNGQVEQAAVERFVTAVPRIAVSGEPGRRLLDEDRATLADFVAAGLGGGPVTLEPMGVTSSAYLVRDVDGAPVAVVKPLHSVPALIAELSGLERLHADEFAGQFDAPTPMNVGILETSAHTGGVLVMSVAAGRSLNDMVKELAGLSGPARADALETLRRAVADVAVAMARLHTLPAGSGRPLSDAAIARHTLADRAALEQVADNRAVLEETGLHVDELVRRLEQAIDTGGALPAGVAIAHNDLQKENVFWDPVHGVTFIDVGGVHQSVDAAGTPTGFAVSDAARLWQSFDHMIGHEALGTQ
ncbi:MAG TPA: trehalose-phosphatase, partial [Cryptosporangiaceae bacterium]|nr:trehalose-phosphatase [Cryptosporangiaceae bacterium]